DRGTALAAPAAAGLLSLHRRCRGPAALARVSRSLHPRARGGELVFRTVNILPPAYPRRRAPHGDGHAFHGAARAGRSAKQRSALGKLLFQTAANELAQFEDGGIGDGVVDEQPFLAATH